MGNSKKIFSAYSRSNWQRCGTKTSTITLNAVGTIAIEILNRREDITDKEALISQVALILASHGLSSETPALTKKVAQQLVEKIENTFKNTKLSKEEVIREVEKVIGKMGNITRESWNGFNNIFKATAEEITEAATRIKNHRIAQNAGTKGNYGYLEGKIGSITKNGEMVRSGEPDKITEIFEALKINPQQEIEGANSWLRNTDSEYKMLNRLANELNGIKGKVYKEITGEIKIISERPYCPSCQGVIHQFNEMYPNVKLILVDGIK